MVADVPSAPSWTPHPTIRIKEKIQLHKFSFLHSLSFNTVRDVHCESFTDGFWTSRTCFVFRKYFPQPLLVYNPPTMSSKLVFQLGKCRRKIAAYIFSHLTGKRLLICVHCPCSWSKCNQDRSSRFRDNYNFEFSVLEGIQFSAWSYHLCSSIKDVVSIIYRNSINVVRTAFEKTAIVHLGALVKTHYFWNFNVHTHWRRNMTIKFLNVNMSKLRQNCSGGRWARIYTDVIKKKLRSLSPQANYTDRVTAACRQS
jgi:hypothetical protein